MERKEMTFWMEVSGGDAGEAEAARSGGGGKHKRGDGGERSIASGGGAGIEIGLASLSVGLSHRGNQTFSSGWDGGLESATDRQHRIDPSMFRGRFGLSWGRPSGSFGESPWRPHHSGRFQGLIRSNYPTSIGLRTKGALG
ncbi:hypothetical protein BHE74_00037010 [Ensete ventricosum]|nr:hypothetical protein BHE74_00037010 [Ensete ventricosum]